MTATDFNRLIGNNCQAVVESAIKKEISIQAAIGILEIHKGVLVTIAMSGQIDKQPIIQRSNILPPNPSNGN
jgi:hypothetical protein